LAVVEKIENQNKRKKEAFALLDPFFLMRLFLFLFFSCDA